MRPTIRLNETEEELPFPRERTTAWAAVVTARVLPVIVSVLCFEKAKNPVLCMLELEPALSRVQVKSISHSTVVDTRENEFEKRHSKECTIRKIA